MDISRVILFSLLNFLAVGIRVTGTSISTALLLKQFGVQILPYLFFVNAIILVILSRQFIKLGKKYPVERLYSGSSIVLTFILLIFWGWYFFKIPLVSTVGIFLLGIFAEGSSFITTNLVWNLSTRYYDIETGKREFPIIAGIGTVGGIFSGFALQWITSYVNIYNLLLWWVLLTIFLYPLVQWLIIKGKPIYGWAPVRGKRGFQGSFTRKIKLYTKSFLGKSFLFYLTLGTVLGTLLIYSMDFLTNKVFNDHFPTQKELVSFLGIFNGLANGLSLIIQLFLFPYLIKRAGIANNILIFPMSTFITSILLFFFPGISIGVMGQFIRRQFKDIYYQLINDLLLNAIHHQEKNTVRTILRGFIKAGATAIASSSILILEKLWGHEGVSVLAISGGLLYIFVGFRLKKEYINTLKEQLFYSGSAIAEARTLKHNIDEQIDVEYIKQFFERASDDEILLLLNTNEKFTSPDIHLFLRDVYPQKNRDIQILIIRHLIKHPNPQDINFLNLLIETNNDDEILTTLLENKSHYFEISRSRIDQIIFNESNPPLLISRAYLYLINHSSVEESEKIYSLISSPHFQVGERNIIISMECAVQLKDKSIIKNISTLISENEKLLEKWIDSAELIEDGTDNFLSETYYLLIIRCQGVYRRRLFNLFSKTPCEEQIFQLLWDQFDNFTEYEQVILVNMAGKLEYLESSTLDSLIFSPETRLKVFQQSIIVVKNTMKNKFNKSIFIKQIDHELNNILEYNMELYTSLKKSNDFDLLQWVLQEKVREIIQKIIFIELLNLPSSEDVQNMMEWLFSSKKDLSKKCLEIIDNQAKYSSDKIIHRYYNLWENRFLWKKYLEEKNISIHNDSSDLLINIIKNHSSKWIQAIALYTYLKFSTEKDILRDDIIDLFNNKVIHDKFIQEALQINKVEGKTMLSIFEKILILKKVPFFSELSSQDLKLISEISEEVFFPAGDLLMKEDEIGSELFILEHGRVRVLRGSVVVEVTPPAHLGEIAILTGGKRTATVEAIEDTNTIAIKNERFRDLINDFPHIIFPIVRILLERILQDQKRS